MDTDSPATPTFVGTASAAPSEASLNKSVTTAGAGNISSNISNKGEGSTTATATSAAHGRSSRHTTGTTTSSGGSHKHHHANSNNHNKGGGDDTHKDEPFISMPLPELYQRRLVMLRELNALEEAIKSLEAEQSHQTATVVGSLAEAIGQRMKAMLAEDGTNGAAEGANTSNGADADDVLMALLGDETNGTTAATAASAAADTPEGDDGTASTPSDDDDDDGLRMDEAYKAVVKRNTTTLLEAYEKAASDASPPITSFIPPLEAAKATQRLATRLILALLKRGTSTLSGLKEFSRMAELACNPLSFAADATAAVAAAGNTTSTTIEGTAHYSLIARLHFRQLFIAEVVKHSGRLVNDALGSALLQRVVALMMPGRNGPTEEAFWYAHVLGEGEEVGGETAAGTGADAAAKKEDAANALLASPKLWDATYQLAHVRRTAMAPLLQSASASEVMLLIAALGAPTVADAACHTHGTRAILRMAERMQYPLEYECFLKCIEGDVVVPFGLVGGDCYADDAASTNSIGGAASDDGRGSCASAAYSATNASTCIAHTPLKPLRLTSKFISLLIDMNGNSVLSKVLGSDVFAMGAADKGATAFSGTTTVAASSVANGGGAAATSIASAPIPSAAAIQLRKEVYNIIAAKCLDLCRNRQGCCTIQRCIVGAPEPHKQQMVDVVLSNALKLVQDPFGNYVIQFLLDSGVNGPEGAAAKNITGSKRVPSKYTNLIIRQLLHHIPTLSTNKFSSNVIEKCLKSATQDVKQLLIDELTEPQALPKLLVDSYANYVIQTAIESAADEAQFRQLRDAILPLQHLLKNSPYGGKIESRLERRQRDMHSQKRLQQQQQQAASPTAATAQTAGNNGGANNSSTAATAPNTNGSKNGGKSNANNADASNANQQQQQQGATGRGRGGANNRQQRGGRGNGADMGDANATPANGYNNQRDTNNAGGNNNNNNNGGGYNGGPKQSRGGRGNGHNNNNNNYRNGHNAYADPSSGDYQQGMYDSLPPPQYGGGGGGRGGGSPQFAAGGYLQQPFGGPHQRLGVGVDGMAIAQPTTTTILIASPQQQQFATIAGNVVNANAFTANGMGPTAGGANAFTIANGGQGFHAQPQQPFRANGGGNNTNATFVQLAQPVGNGTYFISHQQPQGGSGNGAGSQQQAALLQNQQFFFQ